MRGIRQSILRCFGLFRPVVPPPTPPPLALSSDLLGVSDSEGPAVAVVSVDAPEIAEAVNDDDND